MEASAFAVYTEVISLCSPELKFPILLHSSLLTHLALFLVLCPAILQPCLGQMLQADKQDFWGASAFEEPAEPVAPQHKNLVEAGLTDKILAGNLFGDTSSGADAQMGMPMAKAGAAAQEPPTGALQPVVQQQAQQPPQSLQQPQPASGASLLRACCDLVTSLLRGYYCPCYQIHAFHQHTCHVPSMH